MEIEKPCLEQLISLKLRDPEVSAPALYSIKIKKEHQYFLLGTNRPIHWGVYNLEDAHSCMPIPHW